MQKLRLLYLAIAAICLFSFTSCDKEEDAEPSQQRMLTAGQWQGAHIYFNGQTTYNGMNLDSLLQTQLGFNITELGYRFDDNGEYRQTYGRTVLGTWKFDETNEKTIVFDEGESYTDQVTINQLTDTELYLEGDWFNLNIPFELRFTRQ